MSCGAGHTDSLPLLTTRVLYDEYSTLIDSRLAESYCIDCAVRHRAKAMQIQKTSRKVGDELLPSPTSASASDARTSALRMLHSYERCMFLECRL